jgi:hypothetical protein
MKSIHSLLGCLTLALAHMLLLPAPSLAQDCAPLPDGIVSWWPAEGDAVDIISGNNGTLVGATTFAAGMVGQAFKFGGFHDAVQLGSAPNLQLQSFTIEGWIARASTHAASLDNPIAGLSSPMGIAATRLAS